MIKENIIDEIRNCNSIDEINKVLEKYNGTYKLDMLLLCSNGTFGGCRKNTKSITYKMIYYITTTEYSIGDLKNLIIKSLTFGIF